MSSPIRTQCYSEISVLLLGSQGSLWIATIQRCYQLQINALQSKKHAVYFGFLVNIDVPYSVEHKKLGFLTELYHSPINISRSFGVFKYTQ